MTEAPVTPPRRIETRRLVLRRCRPDEAPLLRDAIDSSLTHLRAWMPWAMQEPRSLAATREHIERSLAEFERGEDFAYSIFPTSEREIFGGIGLHRRSGDDCLELGYWVREEQLGLGYATEAAGALAAAALGLRGIARVQIDCDPANAASRRVAEKLGCTLLEHRKGNKLTPSGEPRDTLVFELSDADALPRDQEERES